MYRRNLDAGAEVVPPLNERFEIEARQEHRTVRSDRKKGRGEEHGCVERTEHTRFFREGRAGAWRAALSEQQVTRIVSDHREEMERFGYVPDGH